MSSSPRVDGRFGAIFFPDTMKFFPSGRAKSGAEIISRAMETSSLRKVRSLAWGRAACLA